MSSSGDFGYISPKEAGEILGVSRQRVSQLARGGKLGAVRAVQIGDRYFVTGVQLDAVIARRDSRV